MIWGPFAPLSFSGEVMTVHVIRDAEEVECECGCGEFYPKADCVRLEFPDKAFLILSRSCLIEVYGEKSLKKAKPL